MIHNDETHISQVMSMVGAVYLYSGSIACDETSLEEEYSAVEVRCRHRPLVILADLQEGSRKENGRDGPFRNDGADGRI